MFGYSLADRSFALINIGHLIKFPLFVTEAVLGVLFLKTLFPILKEKRYSLSFGIMKSPWFWFFGVGFLNVFMGIFRHHPIEVMRDAVLIFYAFITFLVPVYVKGTRHIKIIYGVVFLGLTLRLFLQFVNGAFSVYTVTAGMYMAIAILVFFSTLKSEKKLLGPLTVIIVIFFVCIMASPIRTVWVSLGASAVLLLIFSKLLKLSYRPFIALCITGLFSVFVAAGYMKILDEPRYKIIKNEFGTLFQGTNSPNVVTRIGMWQDAIEEIIPWSSGIFKTIDQKIINPFLFQSEERPEVYVLKEKDRDHIVDRDIVGESSTKIINEYLEEKPVPPAPAPVPPAPAPVPSTPAVVALTPPVAPVVPAQVMPQSPENKGPSLLSKVVGKIKMIPNHKTYHFLFGIPFGEKFVPGRVVFHHDNVDRYDPHNEIIAILYRVGVVGLFAFLAILIRIFRSAYPVARNLPEQYDRQIFLALFVGVGYHLAHSMTDVTLSNPFRGGILWLLLGLLMVLTKTHKKLK